MAIANLALRFLTELAGIAAVGYAGFQVAAPIPLRAAAGIGAAVALIVTWAMVAAPKAENGLIQAQKDVIGTVLLLLAAFTLALAGQGRLAVLFAVIVVANTGLMFAFGQGARESLAGMSR
jgi:hypothetical protein